jgi:hypothetical protein
MRKSFVVMLKTKLDLEKISSSDLQLLNCN